MSFLSNWLKSLSRFSLVRFAQSGFTYAKPVIRLPGDEEDLKNLPVIGLASMVYPTARPGGPYPPQPVVTQKMITPLWAQERAASAIRMAAGKIENDKDYVHYLGRFAGMQLEINGTIISRDKMKHYPAEKHTCAHFVVESNNTVYVFWDSPSAAQRKIHAELDQKNTERKGKSSHRDLATFPGGDNYNHRILSIVDDHAPVTHIDHIRTNAYVSRTDPLGGRRRGHHPSAGLSIAAEKPDDMKFVIL
jgi:hypothetical protein